MLLFYGLKAVKSHCKNLMNNLSTPEKQALNQQRREILEQLEDWLEMPMLVLGLAWLVLFLIELIWGLSPLLEAIGWVIWVIFILNFTVEFILAPRKIAYLRSNWLTVISLLLPALRVFRFVRSEDLTDKSVLLEIRTLCFSLPSAITITFLGFSWLKPLFSKPLSLEQIIF